MRRYGWNKKLILCILTNFDEFSVYDTRVKPLPNDKASVARIFHCRFSEYEKNWNYIESLFSKKAVWKGAHDIYGKDTKQRKGTIAVDDDFVKEIDRWRDLLARNIALRNINVKAKELNYAVTKTINRLLFLRFS